MKTLLLFRHGKSDWSADFDTDHERPLARRGRRAARAMGRWLARVGPVPDLVLSSTAVRAVDTASLAYEEGGWTAPLQTRDELYLADPGVLIPLIRATAPDVESLMLVGHEPGWSLTVERLMGGGHVRFPTAAMACLDVDGDAWTDAGPGGCTLRWLVIPKALAAQEADD